MRVADKPVIVSDLEKQMVQVECKHNDVEPGNADYKKETDLGITHVCVELCDDKCANKKLQSVTD